MVSSSTEMITFYEDDERMDNLRDTQKKRSAGTDERGKRRKPTPKDEPVDKDFLTVLMQGNMDVWNSGPDYDQEDNDQEDGQEDDQEE